MRHLIRNRNSFSAQFNNLVIVLGDLTLPSLQPIRELPPK
jgi:hypothetical protein